MVVSEDSICWNQLVEGHISSIKTCYNSDKFVEDCAMTLNEMLQEIPALSIADVSSCYMLWLG